MLTGHKGSVTNASFSLDGRRLVTRSQVQFNANVRVWELPLDFSDSDATPRLLSDWHLSLGPHSPTVSISANGNTVLIQDGKSYVQVWDVALGKQRGTLNGQSASFSPDGTRIALDGNNFNNLVFNVATLTMEKEFPVYGGGPRLLQWGPDNNTLYYTVSGRVAGIVVETGVDLLDTTR